MFETYLYILNNYCIRCSFYTCIFNAPAHNVFFLFKKLHKWAEITAAGLAASSKKGVSFIKLLLSHQAHMKEGKLWLSDEVAMLGTPPRHVWGDIAKTHCRRHHSSFLKPPARPLAEDKGSLQELPKWEREKKKKSQLNDLFVSQQLKKHCHVKGIPLLMRETLPCLHA